MLPTLKVYNIDYEFIIKNYLSPSLWKKIWTLLQYKEHIITLNLYKIMTKDNEIVFEIKYQGFWGTEYITYNINNTSIKILKFKPEAYSSSSFKAFFPPSEFRILAL